MAEEELASASSGSNGPDSARADKRNSENLCSGSSDAELQHITARRTLYGLDTSAKHVGLALSGGGIRSATFSLGLLRGLSSVRLLQRIDYLSTVSGGGYTGAFYCGLFARRGAVEPVIDPVAVKRDEQLGTQDLFAQDDAQKAIGYLRQSGRYLTPGGGRDYFYAAAMLARNWLALTLVIGMAIIFAELLFAALRHGLSLATIAPWSDAPCATWQPRWLCRHAYWFSPAALVLPVTVLLLFSAGWAYWLTISDVRGRSKASGKYPRLQFRAPLFGSLVITATTSVAASGRWPAADEPVVQDICRVLLAASILALVFSFAASWVETRWRRVNADHELAIQQDRIRNRLSQWQAWLTQATFWIALVALADSATYLLPLLHAGLGKIPLALPPLIAGLVPWGQMLIRRLAAIPEHNAMRPDDKPGLLARYGPLLAGLAALLFALAALSFWGGLANLLAWNGGSGIPDAGFTFGGAYLWALGGSALFVGLASISYGFVNLSSLSSFYADRLCTAYLGAGNRVRLGLGGDKRQRTVHETASGDDIGLEDYYGQPGGAPVHLINITINETHGQGPATVQRDRHGLNLVLSPAGMAWAEDPAQVTVKPLGCMLAANPASGGQTQLSGLQCAGQSLPLSMWIGISGAAFSTGLGSATSLSKALLAFFANVRLGYWWNADRTQRTPGITYWRLFSEMIASFPGPSARQWYLSDGGHFENTGVYELLRRQVPFIVVTDNGCDPAYGFEDLANLVRKGRIDFGADITFLDSDALDLLFAQSIKDLRPLFASPGGFVGKHASPQAIAMLGSIRYRDRSVGTLLLVKPRLSENGPADLMRYKADNRSFPQHTTLDQFFDEAQWESYYELGRLMAQALFTRRNGPAWQPADMVAHVKAGVQ